MDRRTIQKGVERTSRSRETNLLKKWSRFLHFRLLTAGNLINLFRSHVRVTQKSLEKIWRKEIFVSCFDLHCCARSGFLCTAGWCSLWQTCVDISGIQSYQARVEHWNKDCTTVYYFPVILAHELHAVQPAHDKTTLVLFPHSYIPSMNNHKRCLTRIMPQCSSIQTQKTGENCHHHTFKGLAPLKNMLPLFFFE